MESSVGGHVHRAEDLGKAGAGFGEDETGLLSRTNKSAQGYLVSQSGTAEASSTEGGRAKKRPARHDVEATTTGGSDESMQGSDGASSGSGLRLSTRDEGCKRRPGGEEIDCKGRLGRGNTTAAIRIELGPTKNCGMKGGHGSDREKISVGGYFCVV